MIRIGKKTAIAPSEAIWTEKEENAYRCQMNQYFDDTQLEDLFITTHCVHNIHQWAIADSGGKPSLNKQQALEKGGLLLGSYRKKADKYHTIIDRFLPIEEVEEQSNIIWKVGKGIATTVAKASMAHPDLLIIGWLHTHPGHGPYLSATDLEQTQVFFPHPYQLAIVIDPLSNGLDVGIYTRQASGVMNNITDQKEYLKWDQLTELSK